jgi:hypothetical protein
MAKKGISPEFERRQKAPPPPSQNAHSQNNPFGLLGHFAFAPLLPALLRPYSNSITQDGVGVGNDPPPPRSCHCASRHHGGAAGGATNHLRCFRRCHSAAAAAATKPYPMFPPPPPPPCTDPASRFHPPTPQWHHHTLSKMSLDQELCYSCTDPKCRHQPNLQQKT